MRAGTSPGPLAALAVAPAPAPAPARRLDRGPVRRSVPQHGHALDRVSKNMSHLRQRLRPRPYGSLFHGALTPDSSQRALQTFKGAAPPRYPGARAVAARRAQRRS